MTGERRSPIPTEARRRSGITRKSNAGPPVGPAFDRHPFSRVTGPSRREVHSCFATGFAVWECRRRQYGDGRHVTRRHRLCVLEGLEDRILLSGSPTIYTVDLTSDTGTSTGTDAGDLLYCITQANANPNTAGSEIEFAPTVFSAATPQTITLSSTLELTETAGPEVIDGPGASIVTISGNNAVEVFDDPQADVTATLMGLTISGGMTNGTGGGINNDGTLTVTNCTIANNSAAFGGGIYNDGILTVTGSTIESNSATEFGGGIDNADGGTVTLTSTTVAKNSAVDNGGGILNLRR